MKLTIQNQGGPWQTNEIQQIINGLKEYNSIQWQEALHSE